MKRLAVTTCILVSTCAYADITVALTNEFIDTYKRRATITGNFTVNAAHDEPNHVDPEGKEDGDMHIAGECDVVGLPLVAEIMNARKYTECTDFVHQLDETNGSTTITGVWRLWFEHPGPHNQVQFGDNVLGPYPTNPYHSFEIHPVTQFGEFSLLDSFAPIKDAGKEFGYKSAKDAFGQWKSKACAITSDGEMTKVRTSTVQYNYVKFRVAKLPDSTFEVDDGTFMFVSVYDPKSSKRYMRKARIVLVEGTPPQQKLRDAEVGKKLTVIGMPRMSLSLVAWRRDSEVPSVRKWTLPFELVIVAVK